MNHLILGLLLLAAPGMALASMASKPTQKSIFADLRDLNALNIPVIAQDPASQVGLAVIDEDMEEMLHERAHQVGKCGGFEALGFYEGEKSLLQHHQNLQELGQLTQKELMYEKAPLRLMSVVPQNHILTALSELSEDNLRFTVQWLSSFPSRSNKAAEPNVHVMQMKQKIEAMVQASALPVSVDLIDHRQTRQKTIRVRIEGKARPQEIVVLGGHLDSINQSWFGGGNAPGADDNASGSANILDVLRVVLQKEQPQRSLEFFWYAGEESGLLGSSEIAQQYKQQQKNVVAVLQLDMTLFPGSGELVLGSMTDFTSSWLRNYLKSINQSYLNVQIVEDQCGYGCSDHASWFRQGYPTLMPFEATMRQMNKNIHKNSDIITPQMSFKHSMVFSKIALIFAMDLANSEQVQLY